VRPGALDAEMLGRVRWRLVAWSGGTTLVVIALLGGALYAVAATSLAASSRQQLENRAAMVERGLTSPFGRRDLGPQLGFVLSGPAAGTFGYIVLPNGQLLGSQRETAGLPDAAGIAAAQAGQQDVREIELDDTPFRVFTKPIQSANGTGTYVVQVVQDISSEHRTLNVLLAVLLVGGLLGLLGAMAVGALYARRALVPIRDSLRRQREFAADASHELRTPLAVIRTSVEHLRRHENEPVASVGEALRDIDDEVEHLTALVGDLLLLARTDSGMVELEQQPVDLSDVAAESLAAVGSLAAGRGVEVILDPEPAPVRGDPLRLRQLVTILVDNAIAHSPEGHRVTVIVRGDEGGVRLRVEDDGPGLRTDDIPHVFDRFWRAPGAPAGGTGLGLAIAAWIADRHHGTITAANRAAGGAVFEVRLPAAEGA
jgi:signal transduction histidine kinase